MKTVLVDWNLIPYSEAWQRQTDWFDAVVRAKAQGETYENRIIMCEHPHVYTLGRSGKENNMLLNNLKDDEKDIKQALDIEENISYLLTEAKIYYAKGDYNTAWEKFNFLSKNIQTSEVHKYLGLCDYALNNLSSALLNIDKAIILSDNDKELNKKYDEIKTALDKK